MYFSTRFTRTEDDSVNTDGAAEVGMEMQIKLDGQSVTSTMEVKDKSSVITQKVSLGQREEDAA